MLYLTSDFETHTVYITLGNMTVTFFHTTDMTFKRRHC